MKRRILCLIVISMLAGMLAQSVACAEPTEYSDLLIHLIESWDPNVSRDELTGMYGEPLIDVETYLSFWEGEKGIQYSFFFDDGRLSSLDVAYVVSSKEHWSAAYNRYAEAERALSETLGKRQGWLYFYNGEERAAVDVDCIVTLWTGEEICVLLSYNQREEKVSAFTQITAVR